MGRSLNDLDRYQDDYNENEFWKKMTKAAKKAGIKLIYTALVLYYALQSPSISKKDKGIIWGALGYFILPLDLFPDFFPGGYTDDLAALLLALYKVANNITPDVKGKAEKKLHDWFGDYDKADIIIDNFNDNEIDEQ